MPNRNEYKRGSMKPLGKIETFREHLSRSATIKKVRYISAFDRMMSVRKKESRVCQNISTIDFIVAISYLISLRITFAFELKL